MNPFPQKEHINGLVFMCVCWCSLKLPDWRNRIPQISQRKGFSPLWSCWCVVKCRLSVNLLLHIVQIKGFSPEWLRICLTRLYFRLKLVLHIEQDRCEGPSFFKYLSHIPALSCLAIERLCEKCFPHLEHASGGETLWILQWEIKSVSLIKYFLQCTQIHCLSLFSSFKEQGIHPSVPTSGSFLEGQQSKFCIKKSILFSSN